MSNTYVDCYMNARAYSTEDGDTGNYEPGASQVGVGTSRAGATWGALKGSSSFPFELGDGNNAVKLLDGQSFFFYVLVGGLENLIGDEISSVNVFSTSGSRVEPDQGSNSRTWTRVANFGTIASASPHSRSYATMYCGQATPSYSAGQYQIIMWWTDKGSNYDNNHTGSFVFEVVPTPSNPTISSVTFASTYAQTITATINATGTSNAEYGFNTNTSATAPTSWSSSNVLSNGGLRDTEYKYFVRNKATADNGTVYSSVISQLETAPFIPRDTAVISSSAHVSATAHNASITRATAGHPTTFYVTTDASSWNNSNLKGRTWSGSYPGTEVLSSASNTSSLGTAQEPAGPGTYYVWTYMSAANGGDPGMLRAVSTTGGNLQYTIADTSSDNVPVALDFGDSFTSAELSSYHEVADTITGITDGATVTFTPNPAGSYLSYKVGSGSYSTAAADIACNNNDLVYIKIQAAGTYETARVGSLTTEGVASSSWSVTTKTDPSGIIGEAGTSNYGMTLFSHSALANGAAVQDTTVQLFNSSMKVVNGIMIPYGNATEVYNQLWTSTGYKEFSCEGLGVNSGNNVAIISIDDSSTGMKHGLSINTNDNTFRITVSQASVVPLRVYFWAVRYQ